jgi:signal transduction histidine kinase
LPTGSVEFDCPIIRADGSSAWICSRGRLVRDAGGKPQRLVGIVMDVPGHTVGQRVLARARRQNESFGSTLAHELRQPLAALLAAVEVARLSPRGGPADRVTEIMKRQIGQMNRVVEDVIDATRWSRGRVTLRKQRLDLRDVISEAALDIQVTAAEAGHELIVDPLTEPSWIDGDPHRLRQALSTLLRNAVKHTNRGGRISLGVDRGSSTITLRVADTGRGIEPDALSRVFDLFSDGGPTESAGLSIDLNIVSEIVALHDGRLEARSQGPGHGSEFTITLLLLDPVSTPSPADC